MLNVEMIFWFLSKYDQNPGQKCSLVSKMKCQRPYAKNEDNLMKTGKAKIQCLCISVSLDFPQILVTFLIKTIINAKFGTDDAYLLFTQPVKCS